MTVEKAMYEKSIKDFVEKHGVSRILTSEMENDSYSKNYVSEDNSEFFEVTSPEYVKQVINVKGVYVEIEVKLLKVEYWSTDDSHSRFYYEQY